MNPELIKRIAKGLALTGAGGAAGYHVGSKIQKGRAAESVAKGKQQSALATKLKERSESSNRRLRIENYYIRRALNELAKKRLGEKK